MGGALVGGKFHVHQGLDIEVAILVDDGAKRLEETRYPALFLAIQNAGPAILCGGVFELIYRDGLKREDEGENEAGENADGEQAEDCPGNTA